MIWIMGFPILFLYNFLGHYADAQDFGDYFALTLLLAAGLLGTFLFGWVVAFFVGAFPEKQWVLKESVKLAPILVDSSRLWNSLITGYVGGVNGSVMGFYHRQEELGYKQEKIVLDENTLIVEGGDDALLKISVEGFADKRWEIVAVCWESRKHEFFIPTGSHLACQSIRG